MGDVVTSSGENSNYNRVTSLPVQACFTVCSLQLVFCLSILGFCRNIAMQHGGSLNLTHWTLFSLHARQVWACWRWCWCIWCGCRSSTLWSSLPSVRDSQAAPPSTSASSTALPSCWLRWPSSSACWPASSSSWLAGVFRGYSWIKGTKLLNFLNLMCDDTWETLLNTSV